MPEFIPSGMEGGPGIGVGFGNPYVTAGILIGKAFGFDPLGDLTRKIFGGIFGSDDRNITLTGVNVGDVSKYPSLIQQQIGLVPKESYTKSKYRHLGAVLNRNLQEMDRVLGRTVSRAKAIAQAVPEFAPLRDQLIRSRNEFVLPNTQGGYGSPEDFNKALQQAFQSAVMGEAIIQGFTGEIANDPEYGQDFFNKYGVEVKDFFGELNRRSEFQIAQSQVALLQPVAGDPNNPQSGKAKKDLAAMFAKMDAVGTPIFDLQRVLPNAQPSSATTYSKSAGGTDTGKKGTDLSGVGRILDLFKLPQMPEQFPGLYPDFKINSFYPQQNQQPVPMVPQGKVPASNNNQISVNENLLGKSYETGNATIGNIFQNPSRKVGVLGFAQ